MSMIREPEQLQLQRSDRDDASATRRPGRSSRFNRRGRGRVIGVRRKGPRRNASKMRRDRADRRGQDQTTIRQYTTGDALEAKEADSLLIGLSVSEWVSG